MKRIFAIALLLFLVSTAMTAGTSLKFRKDGSFKILQLTDMHIRTFNREEAEKVYSRIKYLVQVEQPDLIVLTGDNVTVNPAAPEIKKLTGVLDSFCIPWIATFGNHDGQQELSKAAMSLLYASGKYSLNNLNEKGELADTELEILNREGKEPAFFLFCMDSGAYSDVLGTETYDWFSNDQVKWLKNCCLKRTSSAGKIAPSLAFFHIPLVEYKDASDQKESFIGIKGEPICCGALNSGMFAAMRETGSVIGVSVGHDHDNDFVVNYLGIALCYGRFSGGNTSYNHLPQGARVFKLFDGKRSFETWIREDDGRVTRHIKTDGKIIRKAPRDKKKPFGIWQEIE